jgi:hypothetical protein
VPVANRFLEKSAIRSGNMRLAGESTRRHPSAVSVARSLMHGRTCLYSASASVALPLKRRPKNVCAFLVDHRGSRETYSRFLAQNAPAKLERPNPQPNQEAPRSVVRGVSESQLRTWHQELVAHLDKYKGAPAGRPEGEVVIKFVLDRRGHVVSAKVARKFRHCRY